MSTPLGAPLGGPQSPTGYLPVGGRPLGARKGGSWLSRLDRSPYPLVLPALLYILFVTVYPVIQTFYLSFTSRSLVWPTSRFVGLQNYVQILKSDLFWVSVSNSLFFVLTGIIFTVGLGLAVALLINIPLKGRGVVRVAVVIPWILTDVLVALIWEWLYTPRYGVLAAALRVVGLDSPFWLGDENLVKWSILLVIIWRTLAYYTLMILAALQGVPKELEEQAQVDGASRRLIFRHVTLPLIQPTLLVVVVLESLNRLNMFSLPFVLTGGGPVNASRIVGIHMYLVAFQDFRVGYGSAIAVLMFIFNLIFTMIYMRVLRTDR